MVAVAASCLLLQVSPVPSATRPEASPPGDWLLREQIFDPADPYRQRTVVLLHGFGGSPFDMKPLFDALTADGYRLVAPLIPGEGPGAEKRDPPPVEDVVAWLNQLLDKEESRFGRKPYLVGFSKGGALASLAAAEARAARVVLVAPFYGLPLGGSLAEKSSRVVSPLIETVPKPWKGRINDPEGYKRYEPAQNDVSLKSFLELQKLARQAKAALEGPIPVPLLVLASPGDKVASFKETEKLFSGRPDAVLKSYPGSNHILFYDYAAAEAVEAARRFLAAEEE